MLALALECMSGAARARPLAATSRQADLSIRGIDDGSTEARRRVEELFLYFSEEHFNVFIAILFVSNHIMLNTWANYSNQVCNF